MGPLILLIPIGLALLRPAPAPERIVLLPNEDGRPSAVIVTSSKGDTVVDRPYLAASVHQGGAVTAQDEDPAKVRERYGSTLGAMPKGPVAAMLYFEAGSERLAPESAERVIALRAQLRQRDEPEVTLVGHAARADAPGYNDELSKARAAAVKRALMLAGVPDERIGIYSRGSRDSSGGNADRRVDVRIR